ncbi:MAG: nickel-dependent hydrogenase large subunit, partial [Promethearchaeota archaeon]
CGLCYATQTIASCKALETIYGIEPSIQTIFLRKLLMIGELIKSHCLHFFFQTLPDLFVIFKDIKNPLSPNELIHFDPKLTSSIFELLKIGQEISRIFGGRAIHPITPTVGGHFYIPSKKDLGISRKYFQTALNNLEWTIERFEQLFSQKTTPEEYDLPNPVFIGLHKDKKYTRYEGNIRLKQDRSILLDVPIKQYLQYLDGDVSTSKVYINLKEDQKLLTGPIARNNIIETYGVEIIESYIESFRTWRNSILFWSFLQLMEILNAAYEGLSIIENSELTEPIKIPSLNSIENSEGLGIVEAPRGILIHHYCVNEKNLLQKVRLYIPTGINTPIINEMLTTQSQKLYEKTGDINLVKIQAQKILRCFDPCISCATNHFQVTD